jgi:hypothetical protein
MIITAYNPTTDDLEKSYLTSPIAVGATSIRSKNNDRFATNDRVLIGEMGQEKSEIVTVSSVTGNEVLVTGATVFPHSADDPVYKLLFDQVKFYRSTTGVNGTYSVVSTQTIDVDNENLTTTYNDTTGTAAYYYKTTVYHSISTVESDYSDPVKGSGFERNTVGRVTDELLAEFGDDAGNSVSRDELLSWMNEVNDDLHTRTQRPYTFLHTNESFNRVADARTLAFPVDGDGNQTMWKYDFMEYTYDDGTTDITYPVETIPLEEFKYHYQDNTVDTTTVDDSLKVVALDTSDNQFLYYPPSESAGTAVFTVYYWKYLTELTGDADVLETPGSKIYKDFLRAKYYRKIGKREDSYRRLAQDYMFDYEREVVKLQRLNRKDSGTPRGFGVRGGVSYRGWRG